MARIFERFKKYKELIKSIVVLSITLIVLLTTIFTYAWFSQNKNVTATGMNVQVQTPDVVSATINAWPVKEINDARTEYTFVEVDDFDGSLPPYDSPKILSSIYMKAIVLDICIETTNDNVVIDLDIDYTGEWIGTLSAMDPLETRIYNNHLSNVVQFKKVTQEENKVCTTDSTIYSFLSGTPSNPVKQDLPFTTITIPTAGVNHIYFIMEYNEEFVTYFCGLSVNISYKNDLHFTIKGGSDND